MNNKLRRVLIADDEEKVCGLIRYLVPWDELGLEAAAAVANGLEAIEVLEREHIDIVITDARMPECDGIALVKWCRKNRPGIKHIVISGYRHFEYAHGALQYGVDYYLLKPINQQELTESLRELVGKMDSEQNIRQNEIEILHQMNRNRDKLRRHFISSYIFDGRQFPKKEADSVEAVNEEYQMSFGAGIYQALFIKVDNVENADYKIDRLLVKIKDMVEAQLKNFGNEEVGTIVHSGVILLLNYEISKEVLLIEEIQKLYEEIDRTVDIFEGLEVTIGVSCRENGIKGINHCIATAGEAIKYRIRVRHKGVIFHEEHHYQVIPAEKILTQERKTLLETYFKAGNREGQKKLLFECKLEMKSQRDLSPVMTYEFLQGCSMIAMNVFYEELEDGADEYGLFREFDEAMDRSVSEERLWENLDTLLTQCTQILGTEMKAKEARPIRLIKNYIDEHYAKAISLELVAEKAGLTANYVSAVFRKETGVTFSEYLTAKRMEKATDLLRKTRMSMAEIAEAVGYTDEKYFSKLCKKTLGMKPSEYRKLYS